MPLLVVPLGGGPSPDMLWWGVQKDVHRGGALASDYDYDEFSNLRRVVLPDKRVITYHVDGLNRRVGKSLDGVRQWGLLYANQLEPVAELDADGHVVSSFIYADRPHVPSLMLKGGQTYRIVADHLGSVRLVVDIATGAIAQRMAYDEYGNVVEDTNPGFQPFGYAGGLYDRDTGLVRFGARDYDALTGRWTAKDPIGFESGTTNIYVYVNSDPVSFIDPTGLHKLDSFFGLPKKFWNWFHRQDGFNDLKDAKGQIDKQTALDYHREWTDLGRPGPDNKVRRTREDGAADLDLLMILIPWPLTPGDLGCAELCGWCSGIPCEEGELEGYCPAD